MAMEIRLQAVVGEDRRLVLDLPPEVPAGPVELTIRTVSTAEQPSHVGINPAREALRAKLLAAGLLVTERFAPDDAKPLSDAELQRLGRMPPGARPSEELIDKDRGPD